MALFKTKDVAAFMRPGMVSPSEMLQNSVAIKTATRISGDDDKTQDKVELVAVKSSLLPELYDMHYKLIESNDKIRARIDAALEANEITPEEAKRRKEVLDKAEEASLKVATDFANLEVKG